MSKENKKISGTTRFGHIDGIAVGDTFESFKAMHAAGLHRHLQAGIAGISRQGAESIVISGGYEDDQDYGNEIIYTGQGGRDKSGKHAGDQQLTLGNKALAVSRMEGLPVRVIRGAHPGSDFAPAKGYRYDGLFCVERHWHNIGKSGFKVWRFRLLKIDDTADSASANEVLVPLMSGRPGVPARAAITIQRVLRDAVLVGSLKHSYRHTCQVCGIKLSSAAGPYVEVCHIRSLGRPHNGPDVAENVLCLCPNHHVLFDLGAFGIADDFSLVGISGKLHVSAIHSVGLDHLAYHREHVLNLPTEVLCVQAAQEDEILRDLFSNSPNR